MTQPLSYRLDFGKYRGQTLAQVPASYLTWLVSAVTTKPALVAAAQEELRIRGQELRAGSVIVTIHAVDRFSTRGGLTLWQEEGAAYEGIAHFLERVTAERITDFEEEHGTIEDGEITLCLFGTGMELCLHTANGVHVLRTVLGKGEADN